jgi:hypothetical protein
MRKERQEAPVVIDKRCDYSGGLLPGAFYNLFSSSAELLIKQKFFFYNE